MDQAEINMQHMLTTGDAPAREELGRLHGMTPRPDAQDVPGNLELNDDDMEQMMNAQLGGNDGFWNNEGPPNAAGLQVELVVFVVCACCTVEL